jgi:succinate dehydrogenase / fumarate reductase membrane anchor subunit
MAYLTDRKRVQGMGSAKSGTEHHYEVQLTSAALVILTPFFVFTFGTILGQPYEIVLAYYGQPFPALVAALTILVSMIHFRQGVQVLLEDYTRGEVRHWGVIAAVCACYAIAAAALFALARLAL